MEIPVFVTELLFVFTTLLMVWFVKKAFAPSQKIWPVLFLWLAVQGYLAYLGFYENDSSVPPRFVLAVLPPVLYVIYLAFVRKQLTVDLEKLHALHVIRIPVEIVLWLLAKDQLIPEVMTFEGRNFDIFIGLTAPLVVLYGFKRKILDRQRLILWNLIGIVLLLNIVVTAILAAPSAIQQIEFETPNRAVLQFPFVWLPCFIVPVVLLSHLLSLKKLLIK